MTRVLVLNAGSSSLKWTVLDAASETVEEQGTATWEGADGGRHLAELRSILGQISPVDAVGHRVVHGGTTFREAAVVDGGVRDAIAALAELAPLHNPVAVAGIDAVAQAYPGVPQVAAFDQVSPIGWALVRVMPRAALLAH